MHDPHRNDGVHDSDWRDEDDDNPPNPAFVGLVNAIAITAALCLLAFAGWKIFG